MNDVAKVLRVANCSGFFGDRVSAAHEMVDGGPIDVRTFLQQLEEVLPTCIERGITIVSNAGGLNPEGLARAVQELARRQGLAVRVASVSGDDITRRVPELAADGVDFVNLDTGEPLPPDAPLVTANAYLGARPIADALAAGAQVVVTGRVTDASLTVGPALHAFGWGDDELDAIAGAVVAGHVIECGAQCCGGNYAFFDEIPDSARIGFPIAEIHPDGSSVITKHRGTGGALTVGTVTAQLLYEIAGPRYLSPDAVARFDTMVVEQEGPDRVRISQTKGEPPPPTLKVTANLEAGWRNSMTLAITGALVEEKARLASSTVWAGIPGGRDSFAETSEVLSGDLSGSGMAFLRLAVRGHDQGAVGRAFSGAVVETSLSSYPGTFFTSAPASAQGVARYWPTTIAASLVTPHIECDGQPVVATPRRINPDASAASGTADAAVGAPLSADELVTVPLWVLVGGRSGDKGGDANVGLWADSDAVAGWLCDSFDIAHFKEALSEAAPFEVSRYTLPNLRAVNFVVHGILGWGVASNLRLDSQAKGMAERLRSHEVAVPSALLASGGPAKRALHRADLGHR